MRPADGTAARDLGRPDIDTKGGMAAWVAEQAGVSVGTVVQSRQARAAQAGLEWRANDPVGHIRRKALARLNTTSIGASDVVSAIADTGSSSSAPTVMRAEQPTAPVSGVSARVRRLMGGLS